MIRRPGASSRATSSTGRPTTLTTAQLSADQPIAARASATDDTAGAILTASAPSNATSVVPIPDTSGSPEARATTSRSSNRSNSAGRAVRSGLGHGSRTWPSSKGSIAR